ncbi:MAG: DUF2892 domain-containing protein [Baekduia sp.]
MTKNVGTTDRNIRFAVAVVALVLSIIVGIGSALGIVLLVVAVIAAVTGAVGVCGLYKLLGINTCETGATPPAAE